MAADTEAVAVVPDRAYAGDPIEITVSGFPGEYLLPAGSVNVGGVAVPMPGFFGEPGEPVQTSPDGSATFKTRVPPGVPAGMTTVAVATIDGKGEETAAINVLTPQLSLFPKIAVPNQAVVITGTGFTPSTVKGGGGLLGVHQITGTGDSGITLTGATLGKGSVTYPISLDTDGGFYARIRIPQSFVTSSGGNVRVEVTDSTGRRGTFHLELRSPEIYLSPVSSGPGSKITVTGFGFAAGDGGASGCQQVDLTYVGAKLATARLDSGGGFSRTIDVPPDTAVGSTNAVKAALSGCGGDVSASTNHTVPAQSINLVPTLTKIGTTVEVTGIAYGGYVSVSLADIDGTKDDEGVWTVNPISVLPSPAPKTGSDGGFTFTFVVPTLDAGNHLLQLTVGGTEVSRYFVVSTEQEIPTPAPSPTPTPLPTATPAPPGNSLPTDGLAALESNLQRVWTFSNIDGWIFYDPREDFQTRNDLTHLISGRTYWLQVEANQTVALNGRERELVRGWNLLHW